MRVALGLSLVAAVVGFSACGDSTEPNANPTAVITSPTEGSSHYLGDPVQLEGSGSDPEDGAIPSSRLSWTSSLDGTLGAGSPLSASNLSEGTHTLVLTARDSQGATGTAQVIIDVFRNQVPSVTISAPADGSSFVEGTEVTFSGSAVDPEDGSVPGSGLAWTSDRDGSLGTGPSVATSALSVGVHSVTLSATDSRGESGTESVQVTIEANQLPSASITSPPDGSSFVSGTSITFMGSGTDAEDGELSGSDLTWTSDVDGTLGTGTSLTSSALQVGAHTITLTATDSRDATGTATISITITPTGGGDPYEPDNIPGEATPILPGTPQQHDIDPDTDEDWITFTLSASSVVVLETSGETDDDTVLELFDESLTLIASDDDGGSGRYSSIARVCGVDELPAGTYFARITSFEQSSVITGYHVALAATACADISPPGAGYDIDVKFLPGTNPTPEQEQLFLDAAGRWEGLITGDLEALWLLVPFGEQCGGTMIPPTADLVDDLFIYVQFVPIDGPGQVLGQAGPCFIRSSDFLPILGVMSFDIDDLGWPGLDSVILHEMGHVLGYGVLWSFLGLLADPSDPNQGGTPGADAHFTGPEALVAFDDVGGIPYTGAKVPVENDDAIFDTGSLDSHWRESVFGAELMSPAIDLGFNPLSVVTVESLEDLGYVVDPSGADPYSLAAPLRALSDEPGVTLVDDVLRVPLLFTDGKGGLRPTHRPAEEMPKGGTR